MNERNVKQTFHENVVSKISSFVYEQNLCSLCSKLMLG